MKKLSIAFFGAPDFAAHVLQQVIEDADLPVSLKFVVTQPDRPAGRKQIPTSTPVKKLAQKYNIPIIDNFKLKEVDLVLLYAYGEIIPKDMLQIPRWGFWNIHPSMLPLYRGPSPISYPLLLGDKKTGVSLIQMDKYMDHGPIIDKEEYSLKLTDTQEMLKIRLSEIGYKLFIKNVQLLTNGAIQKKEQNHSHATYTRLLTKQDGFIPFPIVQKILKNETLTNDETPPIIKEYCKKYGISSAFNFQLLAFNLFRALSPWPGLWTKVSLSGIEKRLKITNMILTTNHQSQITKVQLEGKKEVDIDTFINAYFS